MLVASLITVVTLTLLGLATLQVTISSTDAGRAALDDARAMILAEGAVNEAIDALRAGGTGNVGTPLNPVAMGSGLFWVTSTDLGDGTFQLTATALHGKGRAAVEVVAEPPDGGDSALFEAIINSDDDLTMNEGVVTDSFDSSLGTYASQAVNTVNGHSYAEPNGDVRTNSDLILNARATVIGDGVPGPGGSVSYATDSVVTGSDSAAADPFVFPPIDVPMAPSATDASVPTGATQTMPSGKHALNSLTIGKDATLRIEGPAVVVMNDFVGGKDATLEIDARLGPVTIYTETYVHTSGFEAVPMTGSPMALAYFISGSNDIVFPSRSNVRGAYYAPNSRVLFTSDNKAWGAFAAQRIEMASGMSFHFDENLKEHWEEDTGQGNEGDDPRVLAWYPSGVAVDSYRTDRRDPYVVLQVTPGDTLAPGLAREFAP